MLIGLFTLLSILLFGGGPSPFVIPNAKKIIKSEIQDKVKKEKALEIMDQYQIEWKEFNKVQKDQSKEFDKLIVDRKVRTEQMKQELRSDSLERLRIMELLIASRIEMMNLLDQDEWDRIMKRAIEDHEASKEKREKEYQKALDDLDKKYADLNAAIDANLASKAAPAKEHVERFRSYVKDLVISEQEKVSELIELMKNKEQSAAEMRKLALKYEGFRSKVLHSFIDLREYLIENCSDETWEKLSKALVTFS